MIVHLKNIRKNILHRGLGITLNDLRKLCEDHHLVRFLPKIDAIANDYALLRQFFANGFEDPERDKLYAKLERKLYGVTTELLVEGIADQNPTFKQSRVNSFRNPIEYDTIENALLSYDQELTMASLEVDASERQKEIHQRLLRYRIALFDSIYSSMPWTEMDAQVMTAVLTSPLVDVIDQQIILSAILLAQRTVFDVWKFNTLCKVATTGVSIDVSERALVAVALALPDDIELQINRDIIEDAFGAMLAHNGVKQRLTELQVQMILCLDTAKNDKTISKDILPTLMRNSKTIINPEKTAEENIDALLNPDAEERNMEAVEEAVEKMRSMQQNGADVFFGGFSQTKRFSFFYTLMNWFCPFYIEHPQLRLANISDLPREFLGKLVDAQQFCNSDKYSFLLSISHVINQIPKEMIDMIKNGEVSSTFETDANVHEAAFVRRLYLNDLYRFFCLYTDKSHFRSPFSSGANAVFFLNNLMKGHFNGTRYALKVCNNTYRHHHYDTLQSLISQYADDTNMEYIKLRALCADKQGDANLAMRYYQEILDKEDVADIRIVSRMASLAFDDGDYEQAFELYTQYKSLVNSDEDTDVEDFRMALCQMKLGLVEEGMQTLYRLSYNAPDETVYNEALAWGNMLLGKYDEAIAIFAKITHPTAIALLRHSIALWLSHRVPEAAEVLRKFASRSNELDENVIDAMMRQLDEIGILDEYKTEAKILLDQALL